MGCTARLVGTSLLSLQPVHDEEADQDQGESEAEQQVQPSDIGICGHRSTLRFLAGWHCISGILPSLCKILMRLWDKKVLRLSIHRTIVAVDCLDK